MVDEPLMQGLKLRYLTSRPAYLLPYNVTHRNEKSSPHYCGHHQNVSLSMQRFLDIK